MGSRMVKRLLDAGHSVTGYNRTKSKAQWLLDLGMKWADTPRAAAQAGDFVFSMVTNTEALRAITEGPDGILAGLSAGKTYADMSTVSPAAIRATAIQVEAKGAEISRSPELRESLPTPDCVKTPFMVRLGSPRTERGTLKSTT